MQPKLQRVEIETAVCDYDDLAVEYAPFRQLRPQCHQQLGKVAVQRFFVAALNEDLVLIAENQCAEAIPLRLEDPASFLRQTADALCEHRQYRRVHGKIHAFRYTAWRRFRMDTSFGFSPTCQTTP